uniref:Retrovirus-related Pol polyprotein from transposon TNT 1-94 n=1 Tax=Ananas comosus var. bracteatus TaxID=296719 RepID=A0A6V7PEI5_ANACO|nr:unnamed protein product [Ananas comosus var. bracteatus]
MKEGTKVSDHLNVFNDIICELESIGEKMKYEDKAITLLCTLPDSYETLITSLSCTKEDSLDLDTVCSALLANELRKKVTLGSSEGETEALVVRGHYKERENMSKYFSRSKSKNRSKSRNRNDKRLCWFCGKSGHMKKDCLKRKGSNGGRDNGESSSGKQNSKSNNKAHQVKETTSGVIDDEVLMAGSSSVFHQNWILDSGATHHMCPHHSWFITYEECDNGTISIGNNSTSRTVGVGSVRLRIRLGHMSEKGMKILVEKKLIPDITFSDSKFCEHCVYGKHHKRSFKAGSHTSKGILDYIHTDVWSSPTTSYGGANYYISFIDDFPRKIWVKFLKSKGEAFQAFKHFKAEIENLTGRHIKVLRSDNGLEYKSKVFELFCKENGISRHYTNPYDPQQNGVAERMNCTLMERARSMLSNAGLEHELWAEAVSMACYLVNRSPSMSINGKTPEEVWFGTPCDYSNLKIFGCHAYALVPSCQRTKLDPRSRKCIFVGYTKEHESIEEEEVRNDTQNFELPSSTFSPNEDIESEDTPIEYGEVDDQTHENSNEEESSNEGGEIHDLS